PDRMPLNRPPTSAAACAAGAEWPAEIMKIQKREHDESGYRADYQHERHPVSNYSRPCFGSRHDDGLFGSAMNFPGFGHFRNNPVTFRLLATASLLLHH